RLNILGEALTSSPNIALTVQGTWAAVDKTAIQNLQMRRAVALQAGEKLQPGENPGPLALNNEATKKAIEALFIKRFGRAELAALKSENFHAALTQKLQDAEEVSTTQLQALATERQQLVSTGLAAAGVPAERLKTDSPKEIKTNDDKPVPIELGVAVNK
ncbi:MAG: hypothetical protein ACK5Q1_14290, partial [Limnobacter sp.]